MTLLNCEECGKLIPANSESCPECGFPQALSSYKQPGDDAVREERERKVATELLGAMKEKQSTREKIVEGIKNPKNIVEGLGKVGGAEGVGEFEPQKFFGGINKKQTEDDLVKSLFVGTSTTTPSINDISTDYPQPALFFRLIILSFIVFYGFVFVFNQSPVPTAFIGIIITGSFAIPLATLLLFFELNIRKNVPIWAVMRLGLLGGVLSFSLTIFINNLIGIKGAWAAGITEELAKLIALILLTRNNRKHNYILNGLLLGAAVGFGFESFENAGYAFNAGVVGFYKYQDVGGVIDYIQFRALTTPLTHILWTSVAGAALWRVKNGTKFKINLLKRKEFYAPFCLISLCHIFWNSGPTSNDPISIVKYMIIGAIAWILALSLVNLGIKQIADEKAGKQVFKQ